MAAAIKVEGVKDLGGVTRSAKAVNPMRTGWMSEAPAAEVVPSGVDSEVERREGG